MHVCAAYVTGLRESKKKCLKEIFLQGIMSRRQIQCEVALFCLLFLEKWCIYIIVRSKLTVLQIHMQFFVQCIAFIVINIWIEKVIKWMKINYL